MEFYEITHRNMDVEFIQQNLRIDNLNQYCKSINTIVSHHKETGEIYCLWGLFTVHRELIKKGIRISLLNCPNALTFTITNEGDRIVLHCTINTPETDQEFEDSIKTFLSDLKAGINQF